MECISENRKRKKENEIFFLWATDYREFQVLDVKYQNGHLLAWQHPIDQNGEKGVMWERATTITEYQRQIYA